MFVQTNVHDHHDHRISAECVTCLPCMFLAAEDPLERNFTPASSIHCYMQTVKRSNTYPIPHTPGTTTQTHVISHSQANEFRKNVFVSFSKKCILCLIFFGTIRCTHESCLNVGCGEENIKVSPHWLLRRSNNSEVRRLVFR